MSAHVRSSTETSPDGRVRIEYERRDDDDLWGSEHDESWTVVDVRTGEPLHHLHGSQNWSASGHSKSGVASVHFDADGVHVTATHHDGKVEQLAV